MLSGGFVKASLPESVLEERRRSLEWLVSDEDFETVSLDT
jgi:hypothetical protein